MESSDYKQIALIPPNPVPTRAFPVQWAVDPTETYATYGCKTNVILRNLKDSSQSLVYTDLLNKVTSVKWSPDGNYLAVGTDNGKVRIISYSPAGNEFLLKKEHGMINGEVLDIAYTDDNQRIVAVGTGKDVFAKAVIADSGSKLGDFFGPARNILSVDLKKKPFRAVMAGEDSDVYVFDGVPFKHVKTLKGHSNFVNKVAYNKEGTQFATASSDKTVLVFDNETLEQTHKIEKGHTKGIIDVNWLDDETLITSSTDNTVKIWKLSDLTSSQTLVLKEGEEEKVENQQLGLKVLSDKILTVTLNSNINAWTLEDVKGGRGEASEIIQGHTNHITHLVNFNGQIISADIDGRVFSWTSDLRGSQFQSSSEEKLVELSFLAANSKHVYTAGIDGTIRQATPNDYGSFTYSNTVKLDPVVALVPKGDSQLLALHNKNQVTVLDQSTLEVVLKQELKEGEATFLTYSDATQEIWVGDKKGLIHILDSQSFEKKATIEKKHNHGISYMTTSKDGMLVASGDTYRYIYVFNTETKEEVACFPYHTSQINHLEFSNDGTLLVTCSLDRNVGVANVTNKTKKIINKPNEKDVKSAIIDEEGRVITAGYDCSIRIWQL